MADLSPPRGTRDFLPEEKLLRNSLVAALQKTFEKYGFNPLETPALENYDILASKFAGGAEILKELYTLEDQGKRKLGLRYDLTVPLARVFASQKLAMPFKRYAIASVWRDGPMKAGRYREFTQCDVDAVGVSSVRQEAEIMALTYAAFKAAGLDVFVKVNNRKLLNGLLDFLGIPEAKRVPVIIELDKLEKIGAQGVLKELEAIIEPGYAKEALELFTELEIEKSLRVVEGMALGEEGKQGVSELKEFYSSLEAFGVPDGFTVFSPSLARGLNYYTGIVFEAFLKEKDAKLVKTSKKTVVRVLVVPFQNYAYALKVSQELRTRGVACTVDLDGKSVSRHLDFANKQGIPFVVFCGAQEEKENETADVNALIHAQRRVQVFVMLYCFFV